MGDGSVASRTPSPTVHHAAKKRVKSPKKQKITAAEKKEMKKQAEAKAKQKQFATVHDAETENMMSDTDPVDRYSEETRHRRSAKKRNDIPSDDNSDYSDHF